MSDYRVLKEVKLTPFRKPTGKIKHYVDGQLLPPPHSLQIVRYHGDEDYYLFYMNENGEEATDTCHESIEKAMEQAAYEFNIRPEEWSDV